MTDEGLNTFVPVVEALIFASDEPLSTRHLVELLPELEPEDLSRVLEMLDSALESAERGLRLEEVAGGWRFTTREEHGPFLDRLFKGKRTQRLTQAALESLAVVLYRQPATKAEIEAIRGVSVDGPLRTLLDRNLIKVSGRADGPGRPLLYSTTRELLKHLGLRNLRDLPQLDELEGVLETSEEGDPDQLELGQSVAEGSDPGEAPEEGGARDESTEVNEESDGKEEERASGPVGAGAGEEEREQWEGEGDEEEEGRADEGAGHGEAGGATVGPKGTEAGPVPNRTE
ncbi:MAG: SMC-Scp complex subunit ScpB [Gemmatimonadetes bacterium]|nr:SMC-Scp complex subunit ScpB [Gemmatimonadota bacterium]